MKKGDLATALLPDVLLQTPGALFAELFEHLLGQVVPYAIEYVADLRIMISRLLAGLILIALDAAVLLAKGERFPVLLPRELELMGADMLAFVLADGSVVGIEEHLPDNLPAGRGVVLYARPLVLQASGPEVTVCHCGGDSGNREIGDDVAAHMSTSKMVRGTPIVPLVAYSIVVFGTECKANAILNN